MVTLGKKDKTQIHSWYLPKKNSVIIKNYLFHIYGTWKKTPNHKFTVDTSQKNYLLLKKFFPYLWYAREKKKKKKKKKQVKITNLQFIPK